MNTGRGLCGLVGRSVCSGRSEFVDSISSLSDLGPELLGGRPLLNEGLGLLVRTEMLRAVVTTSSTSVLVF